MLEKTTKGGGGKGEVGGAVVTDKGKEEICISRCFRRGNKRVGGAEKEVNGVENTMTKEEEEQHGLGGLDSDRNILRHEIGKDTKSGRMEADEEKATVEEKQTAGEN